jgi:hypothetical protein
MAPNLARLVHKRIQSTLTVEQGLLNREWTNGITGSMSPEAIAEYAQLRDALTPVTTTDTEDKLKYIVMKLYGPFQPKICASERNIA